MIERFFSAPVTKDPMATNGRLYLVLGIFLIGFCAVIGKLFKVQVLEHDALSEQAASQYQMQVSLPARRGVLRDRNGVILATNAFVVKFAFDPDEIKNKAGSCSSIQRSFRKAERILRRIFARYCAPLYRRRKRSAAGNRCKARWH